MINAITIDSITDNGTAVVAGRKNRKSGTAINDSPKPRVDLTSAAIKLITRIKMILKDIGVKIHKYPASGAL